MASAAEGSGGAAGAPAKAADVAPAAGSQLDLADLDEEDLKVLSEVSKKGYYHGRPKNEVVQSAPQRLDGGCPADVTDGAPQKKRTDFDDFQRKWDRLDRELSGDEDATAVAGTSSRTRIAPPAQPPPPPVADEAVVAQLTSMGFGVEESRAAAVATQNRADAAVEYLLAGGGQGGGRSGGPAPPRGGPVKADPEKVAMLAEMGIPERRARKALEKCSNDLERAAELATGDMVDETEVSLRKARDSLAQLEAEVATLEAEGSGNSSSSQSSALSPKQLRGLVETVTQVSCSLDTLDVEGDTELRDQRRAELDRCNALDARITALRSHAGAASDGSPAASATSRPAAAAAGDTAAGSGEDAAAAAAAQDRIAEAERLRLAGNDAFKAGSYAEAAKHYEGALDLDTENVAILSNLAAAELKLERFHSAAAHAGAANEFSGGFSAKALFRQGQALEGLGQLAEACAAYKRALEVEPSDRLLRQRLQDCQRRRDEGQ